MTDIVKRLRFHPADEDEVYDLFNEAADEIWKLRVDCEIKANDIEELQLRIIWLQEQIEELQQAKELT